MDTTAPRIGAQYPSPDTRTGIAWQAVWDALSDGQWHGSAELVAAAGADVAPATVKGTLLTKARRVGLVEVRYSGKVGMQLAEYRRADVGTVKAFTDEMDLLSGQERDA